MGGRALLAGDAAGAVDPYLGEGIRYAVATGAGAARAVLEGTDYGAWFEREVGAELRAAGWMGRLFHALSPGMLERLLANRRVRDGFVEVLSGRRTYRGALRALRRLPSLARFRPSY